MAQIKTSKPIAEMRGKISGKSSNGRIEVTRRKCYGKTSKGEEILGPEELYVYHKHEGAWSSAVVEARKKFSTVQEQVKAELADSERKAYWEARFQAQFDRPEDGKRYVKLYTYVVAMKRKEAE